MKNQTFKSVSERSIADELNKSGLDYEYEGRKFFYEIETLIKKDSNLGNSPRKKSLYGYVEYPNGKERFLKVHRYIPDFTFLKSNIVIEVKGTLTRANRRTYLAVKKQYPEIDLRFIFADAKKPIRHMNKEVSHGRWADTHGFKWSDGSLPDEWVREVKEVQEHL